VQVATCHMEHATERQPRVIHTWLASQPRVFNSNFFFGKKNNPQKYHKIHFTQKYHKNIRTTFEIYHKHKIKLHKSIIISLTQQ